MAIISFVRKISGIYKPRVILQSRDPHDITPEEVQELAELIHANFEYRVDIATSLEQVGKGITLHEILYIWLPAALLAAGVIAGKQVIQELTKIAVQWARDRIKKKGTTRRPTHIFIYGPNGKVLKSIVVKDATQEAEDQTESDRKLKLKRKPPPPKG